MTTSRLLPTNPIARKLLEHARLLIDAKNYRHAHQILNMVANLVDDANQANFIREAAGQCLAHLNGIKTSAIFETL